MSLTRPGPRLPCPAETASCGWCTPASLSAGRGPPARNHTLTCTRGLAAAARRGSRAQIEGGLGREAAHSEVTTRRAGMVRCTARKRYPQACFLSPAQVEKLLRDKSWHPPPGLRQGSALLCRSEAGRPEEPCPTAHTSHGACTHRHIVKFIVRNSLFHQVWLLCGP